MLVCSVSLENGDMVDMEEGNRLIEDVVGCLKGKGLSADYACFILEQARLEVTRRARLN